MTSKWRKIPCTRCQSLFPVHLEWANIPSMCQACRLLQYKIYEVIQWLSAGSNFEVIDPIVRKRLCDIFDKCHRDVSEETIKKAMQFIHGSKLDMGLYCLELEMSPPDIKKELIRVADLSDEDFFDDNGLPSTKLWEIHDILNDRSQVEQEVAKRISKIIIGDSVLYKAASAAAKAYRRVEDVGNRFDRINSIRTGLITDGKRRLS